MQSPKIVTEMAQISNIWLGSFSETEKSQLPSPLCFPMPFNFYFLLHIGNKAPKNPILNGESKKNNLLLNTM